LYGVSIPALIVFSVVVQAAALPFLVVVARRLRALPSGNGRP